MPDSDLFENLIDKIAEAVVRKMDERQKIDLIAQAVIARLEEQRGKGRGQSSEDGDGNIAEDNLSTSPSRNNRSQKTAPKRSSKQKAQKKRSERQVKSLQK